MENSKIIRLIENLVVNGCPLRHICKKDALKNREVLYQNFEESFFPRGIYFNKHTLSSIKIMIVADNPGPYLHGEPRDFRNIDELINSWRRTIIEGRGTAFMRILRNYILPFVTNIFYGKRMELEEILDSIYFTQQTKCGGFKSTNVPWSIRGRCFNNYLKKEIELLKPELILALDEKVYNLLKFHFYNVTNMKICWIKHPSYLARQKSKIKEELERIKRYIRSSQ